MSVHTPSRRPAVFWLGVGISMAMVLTACGSSSEPGASEEQGTQSPTSIETTVVTALEGSDSATTDSPSTGEALPQPEVTNLTIGTAAFGVGDLHPLVALHSGIFEEYGFEVEVVQFEGGNPAASALIADQVDATMLGGGQALSAAAAGESIVGVYVAQDSMTDSLVVQNEIESGEQLQGKQIAISTFGGDSHTGVLLALQSFGLTANDVTIVQIGGESDRYAALQARAVDGAPMSASTPDEELAEFGLHVLVNLQETGLRVVQDTLTLRSSFIEANPNTVLGLVASLMEAHELILSDRELAIQTFIDAGGSEEEAIATIDQQVPLTALVDYGRASADAYAAQAAALAETNDAIASVDLESVFDNSFIEQLDSIGFLDTLGN